MPAVPVPTPGTLVRAARRSVPTLARAWGLAVEATWGLTHVWTYPWGVGHEHVRTAGSYEAHRTDTLTLRQRGLVVSDVAASSVPVLLVHGIGDNRSIFTVLGRVLRRRGFGVVHAVNFSVLTPVTGDIREAAVQLGHHVERLRTRTGSDVVHVIGHSLGGVIARYYVQCLGGDEVVDTLVTMGSAHQGSELATVLPPTRLVRQLCPGSGLVAEFRRPAPGCRTRFLAVWSHQDPTMIPRSSARISHPDLDAEELELTGVGHLSMVVDPRTLHRVVAWMAGVDRDVPTRGRTVA
jgi:pimeloyl-ACP methyl ester carboxylesterase